MNDLKKWKSAFMEALNDSFYTLVLLLSIQSESMNFFGAIFEKRKIWRNQTKKIQLLSLIMLTFFLFLN